MLTSVMYGAVSMHIVCDIDEKYLWGVNPMTKDEGIDELITTYRGDVTRLAKYIPWLTSKHGSDVQSEYQADSVGRGTVAFPIYDSTLLSFVNEARDTSLINENYVYTYSKHGLKSSADEMQLIENAGIRDIQALGDILSKYILVGMYKSRVWTEGVDNQVFLHVLLKLKELVEFWDKPLA